MRILWHWITMAVIGLTLYGLGTTLRDQGWQIYHWTLFLLIPAWIYSIRMLYTTNWDDEDVDRF